MQHPHTPVDGEVAVIYHIQKNQTAGSHQVPWDARNQQGATVATGVYFTRLHYPGGEQTRRLLSLK